MQEEQTVQCDINSSISALTYGCSCLVYDKESGRLLQSLLSVHESYINILHLIVCRRSSYLLQLQEIYNISESEFSIEAKMQQFRIRYYLVLYTKSLKTLVLAFKTEGERAILKAGLQYFVKEAQLYYERLSEYDPFKTEAMMIFLGADEDGGSLLDVEEIQSILANMKIVKNNAEICEDILEINRYLYEQEKLRRQKHMKNTQLNQLGFQYLLKFYSIKHELVKHFSAYCPMFKQRKRSSKYSIIDVVRAYDKPVMSASQLKEFHERVLFQKLSESAGLSIIQAYPSYDGEGKEKSELCEMLSFNNFCSLITRRQNGLLAEKGELSLQDLEHPLSDYYIYTDFTNLKSIEQLQGKKMNHYEMSLKRGCRCLRIDMTNGNDGSPAVYFSQYTQTGLEDLLNIIGAKAFQMNSYPLLLVIDHECSREQLNEAARVIEKTLSERLYRPNPNSNSMEHLPSLKDLMGRVLLMSASNLKQLRGRDKESESSEYNRVVSLLQSKLDFERKGQCCWNYCRMESAEVAGYEDVEDENIADYTKKIMVQTQPTKGKSSGKAKEKDKQSKYNDAAGMMRMGVQMIGQSFEQITRDNYYLQSRFLESGGTQCGYLLKPKWMHSECDHKAYPKNFQNPVHLLVFNVLLGQNCAINGSLGEVHSLEVYVRGNRKDQEVNKHYVLEQLKVEYYTQFNLECEFTVHCPELFCIVIDLLDGQRKVRASRTVCLRYLREGLRPVFLLDEDLKETPNSYLIVFAQKKEIQKKINNFFEFK